MASLMVPSRPDIELADGPSDTVAALAFSSDGRYLAIGVCPGFETGMEDYSGEGRTRVVIRELGETEAKGKGAK